MLKIQSLEEALWNYFLQLFNTFKIKYKYFSLNLMVYYGIIKTTIIVFITVAFPKTFTINQPDN